MTTIADLSRYDALEAVDLYDGVILNIEDPGFTAKRDRAIAKGIPWGTYSWVYPGGGAAAADRAYQAASAPPLGVWLDYEQTGVTPQDLTNALNRGDQLGLKLGVYTYLYIIDSVSNRVGNHPLWLAYYPNANDGTYPTGRDGDARRYGALLWQYTSSNGTRDLSRVLDDTRWTAWTGGTAPAPAPAPSSNKETEMVIYENVDITDKDKNSADGHWAARIGYSLVNISAGDAYVHAISGVPVVKGLRTLDIVGQCITGAKAQKNAEFWRSKV